MKHFYPFRLFWLSIGSEGKWYLAIFLAPVRLEADAKQRVKKMSPGEEVNHENN